MLLQEICYYSLYPDFCSDGVVFDFLLDTYLMLGEELGRGTHSRVATCRHNATGKEFAVKVIHKARVDVREKVLREVEILYLCRNNR